MTSPKPSASLDSLFNSPTNAYITRLSKVVSTTAGLDSTLLLVGYSLTFASSQLNSLVAANLPKISAGLDSKSPTFLAATPLPNTSLARVAAIAKGTKTLAGKCSEVRMFIRLFGLLKVWLGARNLYYHSPKDAIVRVATATQLASIAVYHVFEHGFYLGSAGILAGWSPEKCGRWFRASIWAYILYIAADFTRLARVAALRRDGGVDEKEGKAKRAAEDEAWWRSLQISTAYSPMCWHWTTIGGKLNDTWVGLFGAWVGSVGFAAAWKAGA